MYSKVGVPVKKFPVRGQLHLLALIVPDTYLREDSDSICPPEVYHNWELETMSSRTLKRTYALHAPGE
jgi:hypothetical protein